ncbi:MAG: T9SS type A sorting domain-containing protein [Bacteroidaceae bacterium]|nr:T9SS type A sorting domain-containing protein [Bacteroidaceae bacterium]
MKHLLLTLLTLATLSVQADDYSYLTTQLQDNTENSVQLTKVKKITFSATEVKIYTTSDILTYALTDMKKIYFASEPTDVKSLKSESKSIKSINGTLEVNGTGLLRVYSSSGSLLQVAKIEGSANVSLESLPEGTYIIVLGDESIKVVR